MNQPLIPIESQHIPWNAFPDPGLENNLNGWCLSESDSPHGPTPVGSLGQFPYTCSLSPHLLNISFKRDVSSPLNGLASLKISKTDDDAQGSLLFSPELFIPESKRNRNLSLEFSYKSIGSFVYGSSSDVRMWIIAYDTNGVDDQLITLPYNTLDGSGHFQTQFTTNKSYVRVMWYVATTNADSWDLYVDDLKLGDQPATWFPAISDMEPVTVTGSWTGNATYNAKRARVGQDAYYSVTVKLTGSPTPSATRLVINIPDTIDLAAMMSSDAPQIYIGQGKAEDSGTGAFLIEAVTTANPKQVGISFFNASGTAAQENFLTNTAPFTFVSGDWVEIKFKVPIVGWTSGVKTQGQILQNVPVRMSAYKQSGSALANTNISGWVATDDSAGGFNGTTYTIKVPGDYEVKANLWFTSGITGSPSLMLDGVAGAWGGTPASSQQKFVSKTFRNLKVGQTIAVQFQSNVSFTNSNVETIFEIDKVNTPNAFHTINRSTTKYLASNITTGSVPDIASLRFSNLTVGKLYAVRIYAYMSGAGTGTINVKNNSVVVASMFSAISGDSTPYYYTEFTATASNIVVDYVASASTKWLIGVSNTKITLTELNNTVEGGF